MPSVLRAFTGRTATKQCSTYWFWPIALLWHNQKHLNGNPGAFHIKKIPIFMIILCQGIKKTVKEVVNEQCGIKLSHK